MRSRRVETLRKRQKVFLAVLRIKKGRKPGLFHKAFYTSDFPWVFRCFLKSFEINCCPATVSYSIEFISEVNRETDQKIFSKILKRDFSFHHLKCFALLIYLSGCLLGWNAAEFLPLCFLCRKLVRMYSVFRVLSIFRK